MISGDRILWNAIAVCETTHGKSLNERRLGGILPRHALFAVRRRYSDCWDWRTWKSWKHQKHKTQKTKCTGSSDKDGEFVFLVADSSDTLSGRDHEFREPTLRRETHRKERISAENLKAIEKSSNLKKQKMTWKLRLLVYSRKFHLWSSYWTESSTSVPREESFLCCQESYFERNFPGRNIRCERKIREQPKHPERKNSIVLILQGKDTTTLRKSAFRGKDLKKAFHQTFFEGDASTPCLVSRHRVSVRLISSSNPKSQGSTSDSQVWTWEERSMNTECGSDQRTVGIENHAWFRRLWRSVTQRRMPPETEKHEQNLSSHAMLFSDARRQWKRDERKSWRKRAKTKMSGSLLCCIDGHPPHPKVVHPGEYSQEQSKVWTEVRVHPGECSQAQSQVWKLSRPHEGAVHELEKKFDEARKRAEHFNWHSHHRSGWRLSPMNSCENEFKIILQYKYHHWIFRSVPFKFWQVVNYEVRFIIERKGRELR